MSHKRYEVCTESGIHRDLELDQIKLYINASVLNPSDKIRDSTGRECSLEEHPDFATAFPSGQRRSIPADTPRVTAQEEPEVEKASEEKTNVLNLVRDLPAPTPGRPVLREKDNGAGELRDATASSHVETKREPPPDPEAAAPPVQAPAGPQSEWSSPGRGGDERQTVVEAAPLPSALQVAAQNRDLTAPVLSPPTDQPRRRLSRIAAVVLSVMLPGSAHLLLLGERRRGLLYAILAVLTLYGAGIVPVVAALDAYTLATGKHSQKRNFVRQEQMEQPFFGLRDVAWLVSCLIAGVGMWLLVLDRSDDLVSCPFGAEMRTADGFGRTHAAWCQIEDDNGNLIKHGPERLVHSNGQRKGEKAYQDGELDGDLRHWSEDGKLLVSSRYEGGELDGEVILRVPDNGVELKGKFEDGELSGEFVLTREDKLSPETPKEEVVARMRMAFQQGKRSETWSLMYSVPEVGGFEEQASFVGGKMNSLVTKLNGLVVRQCAYQEGLANGEAIITLWSQVPEGSTPAPSHQRRVTFHDGVLASAVDDEVAGNAVETCSNPDPFRTYLFESFSADGECTLPTESKGCDIVAALGTDGYEPPEKPTASPSPSPLPSSPAARPSAPDSGSESDGDCQKWEFSYTINGRMVLQTEEFPSKSACESSTYRRELIEVLEDKTVTACRCSR